MSDPIITPVPAKPSGLSGSRRVGAALVAAVEKLSGRKVDWYLLLEFADVPQRAHWYRARLRKRFGGRGFEFSANIENGVGRLLCRPPAKSD